MFALLSTLVQAKDIPPNIILFLADDLGYYDLSLHGHPTTHTPNIDRLAREGLYLTQFYSGSSVCTPSRASLLTGRYEARTGVWTDLPFPDDERRVFYPQNGGGLPNDEVTIPKLLKKKNYTSALIGKWHLGHAPGFLPHESGGFDYFFGTPYSHDEGCPPGIGNPCEKIAVDYNWTGVPLYVNSQIIQQPVNLNTLVNRYYRQASKFVTDAVQAEQNFFLMMSYNEVHVPLFANSKYLGKSRRGEYGDAMSEMDGNVGDMMALLDQLPPKVRDNTLVIFTSDNGPWTVQGTRGGTPGQFRGGKGETWEGGVRVPGIFWWPTRIKAGRRSMAVASLIDLLSTIASLADISIPTDRIIDGVSLTPILFDEAGCDDEDGHTGASRWATSYCKGSSEEKKEIGSQKTWNEGEEGEVEDEEHTEARRCGEVREFFHFYRSNHLYATRYRQYKAHWVTRDASTFGVPVLHDPPLIFDIEVDVAEMYPLNPASPHIKAIINRITLEVRIHNATFSARQPAQLDVMGGRMPCCALWVNCSCGHPIQDEELDLGIETTRLLKIATSR